MVEKCLSPKLPRKQIAHFFQPVYIVAAVVQDPCPRATSSNWSDRNLKSVWNPISKTIWCIRHPCTYPSVNFILRSPVVPNIHVHRKHWILYWRFMIHKLVSMAQCRFQVVFAVLVAETATKVFHPWKRYHADGSLSLISIKSPRLDVPAHMFY